MLTQALADLQVLDLTHHISGPYGSKMLADYGADVLKVERPNGGDIGRNLGPFPDDIPHHEKSGLFLHLNTNKRGITLNIKTEIGKRILLDLVKKSDVVIENFKPQTLPSLGLGYDSLSKVNPAIIVVSISNFGQTGPYRDYKASESILHGMGGNLRFLGAPDRAPTKYGTDLALRQAGIVSATATMVALFAKTARGTGEHVDISIFETQAGSQDRRAPALMASQFVNTVFPRRTPGAIMATGIFPCKDGYINITAGGTRFELCLAMIGRVDLLEDSRFATPTARQDAANAAVFHDEYLLPWLMQRTMRDVWSLAQEHHILSGPIFNAGDVMADDHFGERGMFVEVDHPVAGKVKMPGRPMIMSETPWALRRPAPTLGEHNSEVYVDEMGFSSKDVARMRNLGVI